MLEFQLFNYSIIQLLNRSSTTLKLFQISFTPTKMLHPSTRPVIATRTLPIQAQSDSTSRTLLPLTHAAAVPRTFLPLPYAAAAPCTLPPPLHAAAALRTLPPILIPLLRPHPKIE
jgi:hypothetical protein